METLDALAVEAGGLTKSYGTGAFMLPRDLPIETEPFEGEPEAELAVAA
jgi:hypothetical protein